MSMRTLGAGLVSVLVTVAIAAGSRSSVALDGHGEALLRLSWRAEGQAIEECRRLSPDELARLPVHMRTPQSCVGRIADYELSVRLADREILIDTLTAGGARGDRPIYVFSDVSVPAGHHDVEVRFAALMPATTAPGDVPTPFSWQGSLDLGVGEIALITLDAAGERLIRAGRPSGP